MKQILALVIVAACGDNIDPGDAWGLGVTTFDAVALGLTPPALADPFASAIVPTAHLRVPTYDGSGQTVHPDVLREADRLLLAFTPYRYTNGRYENPSIAISSDGMHFSEPAPGVNPLVPAPPTDHNDDPDLHVDPVTGEYVMLYLDTERPAFQRLNALRSHDLVTWELSTVHEYDLATGAPFVVSPAAVVQGTSTTIFDVHLASPHYLERDGVPVSISLGDVIPWHVDVFAVPTGYAMLVNGYRDDFERQDLYLATSPDLVTWTFRPEPLLAWDDPSLDVTTLYRASGIVAGDRLIIWYSHQYAE